jgi:hypothetical protein
LIRNLDPLQHRYRLVGRNVLGNLSDAYGGEDAIFENGKVREQVELLKYHADLAPYLVDSPMILSKLDAVDDDLT